MSDSAVIVNRQALLDVVAILRAYVSSMKESVESAIKSVKANGNDWKDEDFDSLASALNSVLCDVESMERGASQLVERAINKADAISRLHNMKI